MGKQMDLSHDLAGGTVLYSVQVLAYALAEDCFL
jgi:FKBP-type peptidyl-prolyl cis-trans isomerase 2